MIRTNVFAMALATCSFLLGSAQAKPQDLEAITNLLSDAKTEATILNSDAQEVSNYTRSSDVGWQAHAAKLNEMKQHVNKASRIVQDMNNMKTAGSAWQRVAIERITPALNELAMNLQATIEQLNKHRDQVHMPVFRDYAATNAEMAEDLAHTVFDFVNYAQTKAKFENLTQRLELPPTP